MYTYINFNTFRSDLNQTIFDQNNFELVIYLTKALEAYDPQFNV